MYSNSLEGLTEHKDDILIFGSGDGIAEAGGGPRSINLRNLMLGCQEVNLKLNPQKYHFQVKQVTWMDHLLSSTSITPHPDRFGAIKDMKKGSEVSGNV